MGTKLARTTKGKQVAIVTTSRRRKKMTIPITIAAPMGILAFKTFDFAMSDGITRGMRHLTGALTGYDPDASDKWSIDRTKEGLMPILLGAGIHKVANRLGVNRALASAGIPFFRI